jgi:putative methyltransferase (TIGR04325 family)
MTSIPSLPVSFLKDWLPPALLRVARRWRKTCEAIRYEGHFETWDEAASRSSGYDDTAILAKVLNATLKVKRGDAACERDSVLFDHIPYSWPVLAALMWAAARNGGALSVLDFGGALGSSYFQNSKFLCGLTEVCWSVVEQPHYVEAGRALIQDDRLRFYGKVEECLHEQVPNVILLSGVLQCIADPKLLLATLLASGCDMVILDRTGYVNEGRKERISVQHVPSSIYAASYPCRFFVENDMLATFEAAGYALVERFSAPDNLDPSATWKGHIFVKEGA